jgi:hypothetical protein
MVNLGDSAPDVRLFGPDGAPHQLAETWQNGSHALLVFLRHLG